MNHVVLEPELIRLLDAFTEAGGVIQYEFFDSSLLNAPSELHLAAAIAGMKAIQHKTEQWATSSVTQELAIEKLFRVTIKDSLITGKRVTFDEFWGSGDSEPTKMSKYSWSIPEINGYKPAFFHPPYGLRGNPQKKRDLFAGINKHALSSDPMRAEIYSWSTNWSNYFDAGHEWWGAFYWTIHHPDSNRFVVIAASSTD